MVEKNPTPELAPQVSSDSANQPEQPEKHRRGNNARKRGGIGVGRGGMGRGGPRKAPNLSTVLQSIDGGLKKYQSSQMAERQLSSDDEEEKDASKALDAPKKVRQYTNQVKKQSAGDQEESKENDPTAENSAAATSVITSVDDLVKPAEDIRILDKDAVNEVLKV